MPQLNLNKSEKLYQNLRPQFPGSIGTRTGRQARYSFVRADGSRGWHTNAMMQQTNLTEQAIKSLLGQGK